MAKGSGGTSTGGRGQATSGARAQGLTAAGARTAQRVLGMPATEGEISRLLGVDGLPGARVSAYVYNDGSVRLGATLPAPGGVVHITRTFRRGPLGLTVHHDVIDLPEAAQGARFAQPILAAQFGSYERLGVQRVTLDAAKVGRYVWPKAGYSAPPDTLRSMRQGFARATGVDASRMTAHEIAVHPQGKAWLTSPQAPILWGLYVDRGTPEWESVRAYYSR